MPNYRLRDLNIDDRRDAEKLAAMFNDWDSAWPGGFTRGHLETAEHIQDRLRRHRRLANCVVEYDDEFVGFCDLEAQPGERDVAYLPLLGARPGHHGRGVGKMLLREIVRRTTSLGFKELTLYTWPGNTKAVPLYKKTGFQWVPETDVFMRNFIPLALSIPAGREFFANREWYDTLKRDLKVEPDDEKWNGMKVFSYRFEDGDQILELIVDAAAGGASSLKTAEYSLSCWIPVEDAPAGEPCPINWEIESRGGGALDVVLMTEPDAGIALSVQERLLVGGTHPSTIRLTREMRIAADMRPPRGGEPGRRVRSTLLIDGKPVVLETGVKIVRPVEIQYGGQALFAGRQESIRVSLKSNLDRAIEGHLSIDAHPSLECDRPSQEFTLPARLKTDCVFNLKAQEGGVFHSALRLVAGETRGERAVAFQAFADGETRASIDPVDSEMAVLESPERSISIQLRGGWMMVRDRLLDRGLLGVAMAEWGPPYSEWRRRPPLYSARVETDGSETALVLTAPSDEFPGLVVERWVTLIGGSLVRVQHRVQNRSDQPLVGRLRLSVDPELSGFLSLPAPGGLIREPIGVWGDYPEDGDDILADGTAFTENWIACEEHKMVCGVVWPDGLKTEMTWGGFPHLIYDVGELPAHSARSLEAVYLVGGSGNWEVARAWWKRLVQPSGVFEEAAPEPARVLDVRLDPSPAMVDATDFEVILEVVNRRGRKLAGTLTLSGGPFTVSPDQFKLNDINRDRPFRSPAHITTPPAPAAGVVGATLDTGLTTEKFELPVIFTGTGQDVAVTEQDDAMLVENGWLSFRVAPAFLGSIYTLEHGGMNHLFSSYPDPRAFVWANPWFGGVHPGIGGWLMDSRLPRERFTGAQVERVGDRGMTWRGARVICEPGHKDLQWIRLEVEYLTLPGSNLVALVWRGVNRSDARMSVRGSRFSIWTQPGATRDNTVAHWTRDAERRTRRRGGFAVQARSGPWSAVENPETGDVLMLVASGRSGRASANTAVMDFGDEGAHLHASGELTFQPGEIKESITWMILGQGVGSLQAYAALKDLRTLP